MERHLLGDRGEEWEEELWDGRLGGGKCLDKSKKKEGVEGLAQEWSEHIAYMYDIVNEHMHLIK